MRVNVTEEKIFSHVQKYLESRKKVIKKNFCYSEHKKLSSGKAKAFSST